MPIEWNHFNGRGKSADFPQAHEFDSLVGSLSSGAYFTMMNGQVTYWFPNQGRTIATLAVLSTDSFIADAPPRRYASIQVQVDGLDAIAGVAPIKSSQIPMDESQENTWAATLNSDAGWDWTADGVSMSFGYWGSFHTLDPYEFRMGFSPYLTIETETPMTIPDWWSKWVVPLQRLVSLVTGAPRDVTYLLASTDGRSRVSSQDQVFGWSITQQPVDSTTESVRAMGSSINLAQDQLSLLDMLLHWQDLVDRQHPIIETYGSMATGRDQHPRSRFLLLVQALEGLHGFENLAQDTKRQASYSAEREEVLSRLKATLEPTDYRFIRRHLMNSPHRSLDTALIAVLGSLPIDVRPELDATALARTLRATDEDVRVESLLTRARNCLSHGSRGFPPSALKEASDVLDRVVRSEILRLLGAPTNAQERALRKPER